MTLAKRRKEHRQITDAIVALESSKGYLKSAEKKALVKKLVVERAAILPTDTYL